MTTTGQPKDVPLAVIVPDGDMALDFLGLTTAVVNVRITFVVQGGVPSIIPWYLSKGIGLPKVIDCWLDDGKSTVLIMLLDDVNTLVTVDLLVADLALDALAVGDTTDS